MVNVSRTGRLPQLDAAQSAVLGSWSQEALLVLGEPGSGKTTLLLHAMVNRVRQGGAAPILLTSRRTTASQLRNQITFELGEGAWQPVVTTGHGLARSLWQRFAASNGARLLSAPEQDRRVRELLATDGAWPERLQAAVGTRGFATRVRLALSRARQLGLEPEDLIRFGAQAKRDEWAALGRFFAEYLLLLDTEGLLDYAEMIHRVRLLLARGEVAALGDEIGMILVDDYTELDPAQAHLIAALAPGVPVLACADPDSVASAFRGADPHAVRNFTNRFANPSRPARIHPISGGWRYGVGIGEPLRRFRSRLPRTPVEGPPTDPAGNQELTPTGALHCLSAPTPAQELALVVNQIQHARLVEAIPYHQMAVLLRSGGAGSLAVQRALTGAGIPVEIAAEEIPLAQVGAVSTLMAALQAVSTPDLGLDQAIRLLESPLGGFDALAQRRLARIWRRSDPGAPAGSTHHACWQALTDPGWAPTQPPKAEIDKLLRLQQLLAQARMLVESDEPADVVAWQLWQGTDWPQRLRTQALAGGSGGLRADADLDAVRAFFELASESDRRGGVRGVNAFLAELAAQEIPADRERESRAGGRGVQVLTVHRAVGQQWELVVIPGLQDGEWPSRRGLGEILDPALLTEAGLVERVESAEHLASERRLFHLACSRARQKTVVTTVQSDFDDSRQPSRFLAELGVQIQPPTPDGLPVSLPELVGRLRRLATDASASPGAREAAAGELARLGVGQVATKVPAGLLDGTDPANWWGVRELSSTPSPVVEELIKFSPSQVEGLLTCPRRYFLSRRASGEPGKGLPARLGSLVHKLIELAVKEGLDLKQTLALVDPVWAELGFEATWLAEAERVRLETMMGRFFRWWEQRESELLGVEVDFEVEVAVGQHPVVVRGKVDWLERSESGLRVIDFKTSSSQPSQKQVAEMVQFGLYQLAVQSGGFDAGTETVGAAGVYLRLSNVEGLLPKELTQPSLSQVRHLGDDPEQQLHPSWVHAKLAQAVQVVRQGQYPATPGEHCRSCAFQDSCPTKDAGRQVAP